MPRRNFRELEARMGAERIAASNARVEKMLEAMPLNRLREARHLTQEHLANILKKDQSAISQMERRADMYVSTLASFIRALGGELELRAVFADGVVPIAGLADERTKTAQAS